MLPTSMVSIEKINEYSKFQMNQPYILHLEHSGAEPYNANAKSHKNSTAQKVCYAISKPANQHKKKKSISFCCQC